MYPTDNEKEKHFQIISPPWFGEERGEKKEEYPTDVLYSASLVQELSKYHDNPYPDHYLLYDHQQAHHHAMLHYNSLSYPTNPPEVTMKEESRKKKKKKDSSEEEPVDCQECGKQFKNRSSLSSHKKIHLVGRNHVCTECSMAFSRSHDLKRHELIHSQVKPFTCSGCNRSFSRRDALKRHADAMEKKGGCAPNQNQNQLDGL